MRSVPYSSLCAFSKDSLGRMAPSVFTLPLVASALFAPPASAADTEVIDGTTILAIIVKGGADTENSSTSCVTTSTSCRHVRPD